MLRIGFSVFHRREIGKMKKNVYTTVILAVFGICLCIGCAQNTAGDETGVTGSAVSGGAAGNITESAVSGTAVTDTIKEAEPWKDSGEEKEEKYFFANKTNVYLEPEHDYDEPTEIVQYTKSGKKQKTYKFKNCYGLLAVTEEGLYYTRGKEDEPIELCRVPIRKNADGTDQLRVEQTEVILTEDGGIQTDDGGYVDENYIAYITYAGYVIKYNRKTRKKIKLYTDSNSNNNCIVTTGPEYLIIASMHGGYYRLDLDDSEEMVRFAGCEDPDTDTLAAGGNYFFYTSEEGGIWVYDGKTKEVRELLSEEQIEDAIDRMPVPDNPYKIISTEKTVTDNHIADLFYQEGRLYIQFQAEWTEGEKIWTQYVLLSVDMSVPDVAWIAPCYEKTLTDLLREGTDDRTFKVDEFIEWMEETDFDEDGYAWNPSRIVDIKEGKAILSLYQKDEKYQRLACCDLEGKHFSEIKRGEGAEYMSLYYNKKLPFGENDWQLKDDEMNWVPEYLADS